jgi:hypothetical protein
MAEQDQDVDPYRPKGILSPPAQAAVIGAALFIAGYLFPVLRMPYANQGPLVGFFLGPLGGLLGLALGLLGRRLHWRPPATTLVLIGSSAALVGAVWVMCEPEDLWVSTLVEGSVVKCSAPSDSSGEVLARWEQSISVNPQKTVAGSWREDVLRTLRSSSGYLATFRSERFRDIYVGRRASNRGLTYAGQWQERRAVIRYFVEAEQCPTGQEIMHRVYLVVRPVWPDIDRFPPDDASRLFNDLQVLAPVPPTFAAWASP